MSRKISRVPFNELRQFRIDNLDFKFEIIQMKDIDELLLFYRESKFYEQELLCNVLKVSENPACVLEMEDLIRATVQDGKSVMARHKTSGKIISAAVCKLQRKPTPGKLGELDVISASFKAPESLVMMDFMKKVDSKIDLYEYFKTDCLIELMFLATLEIYRGQHLATDVVKKCLEAATDTPALILTVIASSPYTEAIARALGFQYMTRGDYSEFTTPQGVAFTNTVAKDMEYSLWIFKLTREVVEFTMRGMTPQEFMQRAQSYKP